MEQVATCSPSADIFRENYAKSRLVGPDISSLVAYYKRPMPPKNYSDNTTTVEMNRV